MAIHDDYLRRTPLERLFPDEEFATTHLEAIATEMESRGTDPGDPGAFTMLDATGAAVDALRRAEDGAEQRHQLAIALFHAFHARRSGQRHLLVRTPVARWAVEVATTGGLPERDSTVGPAATYVQLPQHLFWVREEEGDAPTSLDGWFWTEADDRVVVMGVTGVHGPSGGFSVLPLPPLPRGDAEAWTSTAMREEGEDFRSSMPGAELEGLYELRTAGELLKLATRIARFAASAAGARVTGPSGSPGPGAPEPSALNFQPLELD